MCFAPGIDIQLLLDQFLSQFEKLHFLIFDLWVFVILGPVEYSTGLKSAKYRPEPIQIPQAPFRRKWSQLLGRYSIATLKYVRGC